MPIKYEPMAWETRKPLSPYWNRVILEARLAAVPIRRPMVTRNGEPAVWSWLQFRAIYKHKHHALGPKLDDNPIWGEKILMKVYAFGDTGTKLYRFDEGDWVRIEGYLTGNKFKNGDPVLCILAKQVTLLAKRFRPKLPKFGNTDADVKCQFRTVHKIREEERDRLIAKGLIKPSMGDLARMPDEVPSIDQDSLDTDI